MFENLSTVLIATIKAFVRRIYRLISNVCLSLPSVSIPQSKWIQAQDFQPISNVIKLYTNINSTMNPARFFYTSACTQPHYQQTANGSHFFPFIELNVSWLFRFYFLFFGFYCLLLLLLVRSIGMCDVRARSIACMNGKQRNKNNDNQMFC